MECKIGEIFEYNGKWFQCLESNNCRCDYCELDGVVDCCQIACTSGERIDDKEVYFKKLEKPLKIYNRIVLKVKADAYNCMRCCFYSKAKCELTMQECEHYDCGKGTKFIEIKQNKEDMEEYKMYDAKEDIPEFDKVVDECLFGKQELKLKPFDLQKAKEGKPVCTRDGRKARIICFDKKHEIYPIVALIESKTKDEEYISSYTKDGKIKEQSIETCDDLMILPEKKEGWVNVYKKSIYKTKEDAFNRRDKENYLMTIKVGWEE